MKKKIIWIILALFLIGSGNMVEAQVVKKTVKDTPVVIEEEDEEDDGQSPASFLRVSSPVHQPRAPQ